MGDDGTMKDKKGFTLAELLIVVAIIGVLVAVSIPIFTNNLRKAKIATNKANIRAAKAAAIAEYYDPSFTTTVFQNKLHCQYYKYDVKTGTIENVTNLYTTHDQARVPARVQYNNAKNYKVCDYIYVYVGESDKTGTISDINVETAPYYIGDEVEMKNNNPFGWMK